MTRKILRELERRISKHLYNETEIMKDILEADLTKEEWKELSITIKSHPHHELVNYLKNIRSDRATS